MRPALTLRGRSNKPHHPVHAGLSQHGKILRLARPLHARASAVPMCAEPYRKHHNNGRELSLPQEGEEQELLGGAPATSLHEKAPCNPEKEHMFLMKSVSLPSNMLLSKAVSLSMPCPTSKEGRRLWARLPSILASLAVIALVVLSTVALCRSRTAGPVTSAAAQLPRKFLSKCAPLPWPAPLRNADAGGLHWQQASILCHASLPCMASRAVTWPACLVLGVNPVHCHTPRDGFRAPGGRMDLPLSAAQALPAGRLCGSAHGGVHGRAGQRRGHRLRPAADGPVAAGVPWPPIHKHRLRLPDLHGHAPGLGPGGMRRLAWAPPSACFFPLCFSMAATRAVTCPT